MSYSYEVGLAVFILLWPQVCHLCKLNYSRTVIDNTRFLLNGDETHVRSLLFLTVPCRAVYYLISYLSHNYADDLNRLLNTSQVDCHINMVCLFYADDLL